MGQPPFAYVAPHPNSQAGQMPSAPGAFIPPCVLPHIPVIVPWLTPLFTPASPTAPNVDQDLSTAENPGGPPSNQQRGYNNQSNTAFWSPLARHGYSASLRPTNPPGPDGIFAATYIPRSDSHQGIGDTTDKPSLDHTASWSCPQPWYDNKLLNGVLVEKTQSNAMPSKVRYRVRKSTEPKDGISLWRTERAYSPSPLFNSTNLSHPKCEHGSTLNKLPTNECVHVRITGTSRSTPRNSTPIIVVNDRHLPPPPACRCCQCTGTIGSRQLTNNEDYAVVVLASNKLGAQPARYTAAEERVMDQVRCFCSTDLNATHSIEAVELPVNATTRDRSATPVTVPNAESQVSSDSILTAFVNAASRKLDNDLKQRRMNRLTPGI
ncbi:unnamed protein product [Dicrocoelium dendriticum]|nr:unnamed protein product [Dicrocoelium dendriticum]